MASVITCVLTPIFPLLVWNSVPLQTTWPPHISTLEPFFASPRSTCQNQKFTFLPLNIWQFSYIPLLSYRNLVTTITNVLFTPSSLSSWSPALIILSLILPGAIFLYQSLLTLLSFKLSPLLSSIEGNIFLTNLLILVSSFHLPHPSTVLPKFFH